MGKRKDEEDHGHRGEPAGAAEGHGRRSLELGRREINLEFLKRFGAITIPGVGKVSLLYRNPLRGKVTVHFTPSEDLTRYLQEENDNDGKEQRFGKPDD